MKTRLMRFGAKMLGYLLFCVSGAFAGIALLFLKALVCGLIFVIGPLTALFILSIPFDESRVGLLLLVISVAATCAIAGIISFGAEYGERLVCYSLGIKTRGDKGFPERMMREFRTAV